MFTKANKLIYLQNTIKFGRCSWMSLCDCLNSTHTMARVVVASVVPVATLVLVATVVPLAPVV